MKNKDLTLPELKVGELPKPEEKVKVDWNVWAEQEALLETEPEDNSLTGEYSSELTPTEPEETAYHIPAHYKDLGDLTEAEWKEVFGKGQSMLTNKTIDTNEVENINFAELIKTKMRRRNY